jgi:carboxypeptidase Q
VFVQAGRDNPSDTLPKVVLAGEHYNMLMRMAQQGIAVKLRVNVQARFLDQDRNTYNVLAEIPGSDPAMRDQVVMLGAHLDSWHTGTGATDNADGVAAVMEAFRILKASGLQPKRTLRLALWSAEEEGLFGSKAWVASHLQAASGARAKETVSVYFNIDPGKGPIYGWYLENNDDARPIFDAWMAPFKDLGALKNVRPGIGNTDHLSFIAAGVPGFNPIQDYVDYDVREHHTNADTAERVKETDLKQNAVVLASVIYHAAMRISPIPSPVRK